MDGGISTRLLVLVGLAAVGIGLAGVGTSLGMAELTSNPPAEFIVGDDNIKFNASGESTTVVENLSYVQAVNIDETDTGQFTIQTVTEQPLTAREREQAREIVLSNATISAALAEIDSYTLSVDPIQKLNASAFNQVSYDSNMSHESGDSITIVETSEEKENSGSVTIEREPNYAEDRATVQICQPDAPPSDDLKYSVDVDLENDTITDITDWEAISQEAPTVTTAETFNVTVVGE